MAPYTDMDHLQEITRRLELIEVENDVTIIYACESGSRAWGFPSADSDYDVRFIYARKSDWYLYVDLQPKRDVIEVPIVDEFDINGWDLKKALGLLYKSNPPLLEWLQSPIVYCERSEDVALLREMLTLYYSPVSAYYHYRHMAQGNNREFLQGDLVRLKKYFYVLRPILAMHWIQLAPDDPVPTEFSKLLDRCLDDIHLRSVIDDLLQRKMAGEELDKQPPVPELNAYIDRELASFTEEFGQRFIPAGETRDFESLNETFKKILKSL